MPTSPYFCSKCGANPEVSFPGVRFCPVHQCILEDLQAKGALAVRQQEWVEKVQGRAEELGCSEPLAELLLRQEEALESLQKDLWRLGEEIQDLRRELDRK